MAGDGLSVDSLRVGQTGYLVPTGKLKPLTEEDKQKFIDLIRRLKPDLAEDKDYKIIADKNGHTRLGKVVKYQPLTLADMFKGEKLKELPKVKKAQVTKFLDKISALGLDLTIDDIMTKNGILNPNFKVDKNGNISFRNIKAYMQGKTPDYFETKDGEWAEEKKFEYPKSLLKTEKLPKGYDIENDRKFTTDVSDSVDVRDMLWRTGRDEVEVQDKLWRPGRDEVKIQLY